MKMTDFTGLGFIYTYKCVGFCDHCLTLSGPSREEKISFQQAKKYINIAKRLGMESVNFTGGECLFFYDEMCDLLKLCSSLKLDTSIVTSAYWADSYSKSIAFLTKLVRCGLKRLVLSTDRFHLPFIKFRSVSTAIRAAKKINLDCAISMSRVKDDKIANSIQDRIKRYNVRCRDLGVLSGGRATSIPRDDLMLAEDMPRGSCGDSFIPAITPDGKVTVCCSLSIHSPTWSPLVLGNTNLEPLDQILKRAKNSRLLHYLKMFGPYGLYKELQKTCEGKNFRVRKDYCGICELCIDLLESKEAVDALQMRLQDPEISHKITCAEFLQECKQPPNKTHKNI